MTVVVDAHHHFWDPARADYPWMTDELAAIRRRFGPEELRPLLEANGVDRTVLVQARSDLGETRELLAIAAQHDFIAGVVGWIDLAAPDVAQQLATLRAGPGGPKLVAIRHQAHDEPDPAWLGRSEVRRGLAAVGQAGLAYDLLVRTRELPAALALVRDLPGSRFVVDHLAKPPIASGAIGAWAAALQPLAEYPNVYCKLSGMVTEADWARWTARDLAPYASRALEWFGPERCVFGSDWPACLVAASYAQVIAACREAIGERSPADRDRIFGGTAVELYRLPVAVNAERRS